MDKKKLYIGLIAFIVLFLASMPFWYNLQQAKKKAKKIDWTPTFKKTESKPYASKALFTLIKDLFPDKDIVLRTKVAPRDSLLQTLGKKYNLFFANRYMDSDVEYSSALYFFVSGGGEAFVATTEIEEHFSNLLGDVGIGYIANSEALNINFTNPKLKAETPYHYPNIIAYHYFTRYNEEECTILATDNQDRPILIKVPIGNGHFYLCSIPIAFTNFNMVDQRNYEVISKSLSYLPLRDVLWEDLPSWQSNPQQNGRNNRNRNYDPPEGIKELAFLQQHDSLWWAFLVACAALLAFIIFRAKREQRAIPIIEKPTNSSIEFAQTIGRLYFNHHDHKNLAEKKILYLFDFIRNQLHIAIQDHYDQTILSKIAQKAAIPENDVNSLFENIQSVRSKSQISAEELAQLNTKINDFRKKCT